MKAIIVDDESFSADYLENLCDDMRDIEVTGKFGNAFDAVDFLKENEADLVFMDIEMPGITGIEAAQEMREIKQELAVIFVTGYEHYALDAFKLDAVAYLLKPCTAEEFAKAVEKAAKLIPRGKNRLCIQTFGRFDVFIDGEPYHFRNHKAKELLALLVDRNGGESTMEQAVDILWEQHPYDEAVKQLYRKAVIYLKQMMKQYGLDFFAANRGSCHINPEKADCDYFDFMKGNPGAREAFFGEYMIDYSWGEETLAKIAHLAEKK